MKKQTIIKTLSSNKYRNKPKVSLDQFIKQLQSRLDSKLNKLRKELDNYYIVCDDKEKEQQTKGK